jgi:hypothetical protein
MMSFMGIKVNLSMVFQIAAAAVTGGASMAVTIQQMAMKAAVQAAIQQIGQQMGLPPQVINFAQNMAAGQMGGAVDYGSAGSPRGYLNLIGQSGVDGGNFQRSIDTYTRSAVSFGNNFSAAVDRATRNYEAAVAARDAAIAGDASQRVIDRLQSTVDQTQSTMNNMDEFFTGINLSNSRRRSQQDISNVMNGKGSLLMKIAILLGMIADQKMSDMATKAEQIGKMNAELQALGQELGTISQATANVIKSIGEASQALARKG